MTTSTTVVVGAGAAGLAACWELRRQGRDVTIVFDGGGASALYAGALWSAETSPARSDVHGSDVHGSDVHGSDVHGSDAHGVHDSDVSAFLEELGLWKIGSTAVATTTGVIVQAAGADFGVLNLHALRGQSVGVLEVQRAGWDARWMARSLTECAWARAHGTQFEARAAADVLTAAEQVFGDVDLAQRLSEPERRGRLLDALRAASTGVDAWLVGPWLSASAAAAQVLHQELNVPVGEVLSPVGSAAGLRWETARDAFLSRLGARVLQQHVRAVTREAGTTHATAHRERWRVVTDAEELCADAVVLATGGVAGGGLTLAPAGASTAFVASFDAPLFPAFAPEHKQSAGTAALDLVETGVAVLERAGFRREGAEGEAHRTLVPAGDAVFDQPRAVLAAIKDGLSVAKRLVLSSD